MGASLRRTPCVCNMFSQFFLAHFFTTWHRTSGSHCVLSLPLSWNQPFLPETLALCRGKLHLKLRSGYKARWLFVRLLTPAPPSRHREEPQQIKMWSQEHTSWFFSLLGEGNYKHTYIHLHLNCFCISFYWKPWVHSDTLVLMQTHRILSSFPSFCICDSSLPTVRHLPRTTFKLFAYVINALFVANLPFLLPWAIWEEPHSGCGTPAWPAITELPPPIAGAVTFTLGWSASSCECHPDSAWAQAPCTGPPSHQLPSSPLLGPDSLCWAGQENL